MWVGKPHFFRGDRLIVLYVGCTADLSRILEVLIYLQTFRQMAAVAADAAVDLRLVRNPSPLVHAALALVILLIATVLAIYKPQAVTPYGRRKLHQQSVAPPT